MIVIAVGDLHGRLKTLDRLRSVQARYPNAVTVFIGDYVDCYGPNSGLALLEQIHEMKIANEGHTVVLMGNHDASMLNFMKDAAQDDWLNFGGLQTMVAEAARLGISPEQGEILPMERLALRTRERLLEQKNDLLEWVAKLPLTHVIDNLVFVHAGLNQSLDNPLEDTTAHDRLWLRHTYWYAPQKWRVFDHNKLRYSLITGHTPTREIIGRYADMSRPDKVYDPQAIKSPIYSIQYPDEMPRYQIDGGVGSKGADNLLGNVGVFDSQTGLLIDAVED
ncbi:metallophosphoesterase family protein [Lacticaseibacillus nasuensis]|uniref:metallophosphoesterase family protein n=1 Tax=Lacticaseibacillus nasuensis TaxID=944671 RepID=UPI00224707B1|nr:metallophosphoesterase family protein [Lacticaseibacillus nasuensis]MCX2455000.1 serine/threonine protein phosphatase [Lacticaseibacillus nasuensis]